MDKESMVDKEELYTNVAADTVVAPEEFFARVREEVDWSEFNLIVHSCVSVW